MYKFGLIGYPLGHSISADIQRAGFNSLNIEATYDILETPPEELVPMLKYLKTNGYNGFNVTIPLKVPVSIFLNEIDDYANHAGCVNTVKITENLGLSGFNTDIAGFKRAIPADIDLTGKTASILGTGGAARAAVVALSEKKIKNTDFYTRNIINAQPTLDYMRHQFPDINFGVYQIQNIRSLENTDILVNATPIGMLGFMPNEMPLETEDLNGLKSDAIVYDIVYNPVKTLLIQESKKRGLKTISGLDMLVCQAQESIKIWTGKLPDFNAMKLAAYEALQ